MLTWIKLFLLQVVNWKFWMAVITVGTVVGLVGSATGHFDKKCLPALLITWAAFALCYTATRKHE